MKVLTAAEMREVDRRTMERGIPGLVLMENAAHRVVEFLAERYAPLAAERILVLCGKGNNGGDGFAIARQLRVRFQPADLWVVLLADAATLNGDAAANYRMLLAAGGAVERAIPPAARFATLVVDAILGTGTSGPARGAALEAIREINSGFPLAEVVAVDIPSGMPSDCGEPAGEWARADATVTFTAPKVAHALAPNCDHVGELIIAPIGSAPDLLEGSRLELVEPALFPKVLEPRPRSGHKGTFGHVLVAAGGPGKSGAAVMCGLAALRAGAGLVTVASHAAPGFAAEVPELMTEQLTNQSFPALARGKTVIAMGPGLGRSAETDSLVAAALADFEQPLVLDADGLSEGIRGDSARVRILTPHPGEMARLTGKSTAEIQASRVDSARSFARERQVTLVLKGQRTLIAFADGRVWINPTGTPAMGKGGAGDVLTGLIAGLVAQFPEHADQAVAAAVYVHGLAGELATRALGEKAVIARDILGHLPAAWEKCAGLPHRL
ncbi:MAG: NAD(P)H-hydrate dehydratase [Bryobacteraceae bacterium]